MPPAFYHVREAAAGILACARVLWHMPELLRTARLVQLRLLLLLRHLTFVLLCMVVSMRQGNSIAHEVERKEEEEAATMSAGGTGAVDARPSENSTL
jgi:hypothetical protein